MKVSLKKQKTKKQKQKQNVILMIKFLFTAPQFSFLHNYDVSSPQFKIKHV